MSGDYFETMGIPLLEGRLLLPDDSTTRATGVVINRALAEKAWPGESALGKRFSYSDDPPDWLTVVGVVGATRLIRDGQRIRVHGAEGYVEVL